MKEEVVDDISIGGHTLAAAVIRAGLVDGYQMFVVPIIVGGALVRSPLRFGSTSSWWISAASTTAWCI